MRVLKAIGKFFWRFMVIFSFIVNLVLIIVLLTLGVLIFDIKNNIAQPLVAGLHSSFVGLDEATIDWTIPVRDQIQVKLDIPLETETVVTLTRPVPLSVSATILRQGVDILGGPVQVNLQLPAGLELPVALDLDVLVDQPLPVSLDVRAVIPLEETQLHDVADNLRLLFEPLVRALYNLPNNFNEAGAMVGNVLAGSPPNLLADNAYTLKPWPGFSKTAGMNYALLDQPVPPQNQPLRTGIVPIGGIPALDEQIRPDVYQRGGPATVNDQVASTLESQCIPEAFYNGQIEELAAAQQAMTACRLQSQAAPPSTGGSTGEPAAGSDLGIIPTPGAGGQG